MPTACITPPAFGARASSLDELTGTWWVVQVRPNRERKMAQRMLWLDVDYFLPTELVKTRRGKDWRTEKRLTLPGYLFINGSADARYEAASDEDALRIIEVKQQSRLAHELKAFEWIAAEPAHVAGDFTPKKGMRCRVVAGHPLEGHEGWIDDVTGGGMVVVKVTMIGEGTPVEIDPLHLERVD
jgi:transcription antitermination factor NusG